VITRKQLLFSRDNEKIKSWSRDNKLSRDHEITRKKNTFHGLLGLTKQPAIPGSQKHALILKCNSRNEWGAHVKYEIIILSRVIQFKSFFFFWKKNVVSSHSSSSDWTTCSESDHWL